jgi:hypothetical protein
MGGRAAAVAAAGVVWGVPGDVQLGGPLALEGGVSSSSGSSGRVHARVFWPWAWCEGREGHEGELGGIGRVADLGGEALLDVVRVRGRRRGRRRGGGRARGGRRRGPAGVGGGRWEGKTGETRERLGLPGGLL